MAIELEKVARDFLRKQGFDCEYYAPDAKRNGLVTVKRTSSSGGSLFVGRAIITVQTWGATRGNAEVLCENVVDALCGRGAYEDTHGLRSESPNITQVEPGNGPYRWDDPNTKDFSRWQATVAIAYNA